MEQHTPAKRQLTTIGVSPAVQQKAKAHADTLGLSLKEFAEGTLLYFVKYKLHPDQVNSVEDVPKEVHKLRNQVFSFLQKQELQHLLPLIKQVYTLQAEMEKLYQQQEAVYLLLFKIKTIQDISLTTLYKLSEQDEETLSGIIQQNKQRFLNEMQQFKQKMETVAAGNPPEPAGS